MKSLVILLIRLYKKFVSPLLPPSCRFTPSCSEYALLAFQRHSFFSAFWISTKRVLRCNPYFEGGYDPVPEIKFKR